jgi:hypothetical protein
MNSFKWSAGLIICLLSVGCSSGYIKAKGRVLKGGVPYTTSEGEGMRIFFVPVGEIVGTRYDSFAAVYNPKNGSFVVNGKDGRGLPPGKYRIGLQLMKGKDDLLKGRLLTKNTPLTCEVASSWGEIVIELDDAKFDEVLQAAQSKKGKRG